MVCEGKKHFSLERDVVLSRARHVRSFIVQSVWPRALDSIQGSQGNFAGCRHFVIFLGHTESYSRRSMEQKATYESQRLYLLRAPRFRSKSLARRSPGCREKNDMVSIASERIILYQSRAGMKGSVDSPHKRRGLNGRGSNTWKNRTW